MRTALPIARTLDITVVDAGSFAKVVNQAKTPGEGEGVWR
jgi:hypothetical protein